MAQGDQPHYLVPSALQAAEAASLQPTPLLGGAPPALLHQQGAPPLAHLHQAQLQQMQLVPPMVPSVPLPFPHLGGADAGAAAAAFVAPSAQAFQQPPLVLQQVPAGSELVYVNPRQLAGILRRRSKREKQEAALRRVAGKTVSECARPLPSRACGLAALAGAASQATAPPSARRQQAPPQRAAGQPPPHRRPALHSAHPAARCAPPLAAELGEAGAERPSQGAGADAQRHIHEVRCSQRAALHCPAGHAPLRQLLRTGMQLVTAAGCAAAALNQPTPTAARLLLQQGGARGAGAAHG